MSSKLNFLKKFNLETVQSKNVVVGIVALTVLDLYALSQGINGILFTVVVTAIAAAIGVSLPKLQFIRRG